MPDALAIAARRGFAGIEASGEPGLAYAGPRVDREDVLVPTRRMSQTCSIATAQSIVVKNPALGVLMAGFAVTLELGARAGKRCRRNPVSALVFASPPG